MNVSVKINGLEELNRRLQSMKQEFAAKSLVSAAYAANKAMSDGIKNEIGSMGLVDTGLLMTSIGRRKRVYPRDGRIFVASGVKTSTKGVDRSGRPRVPRKYVHILEKRYGFTKSAYEKNREAVVDEFTKTLKNRIDRYTRP